MIRQPLVDTSQKKFTEPLMIKIKSSISRMHKEVAYSNQVELPSRQNILILPIESHSSGQNPRIHREKKQILVPPI